MFLFRHAHILLHVLLSRVQSFTETLFNTLKPHHGKKIKPFSASLTEFCDVVDKKIRQTTVISGKKAVVRERMKDIRSDTEE